MSLAALGETQSLWALSLAERTVVSLVISSPRKEKHSSDWCPEYLEIKEMHITGNYFIS